MPYFCRYVNALVLVALADGTIAIFHRASGECTFKFVKWLLKCYFDFESFFLLCVQSISSFPAIIWVVIRCFCVMKSCVTAPKKDSPNFFNLQSISNLAIRKLGLLFQTKLNHYFFIPISFDVFKVVLNIGDVSPEIVLLGVLVCSFMNDRWNRIGTLFWHRFRGTERANLSRILQMVFSWFVRLF